MKKSVELTFSSRPDCMVRREVACRKVVAMHVTPKTGVRLFNIRKCKVQCAVKLQGKLLNPRFKIIQLNRSRDLAQQLKFRPGIGWGKDVLWGGIIGCLGWKNGGSVITESPKWGIIKRTCPYRLGGQLFDTLANKWLCSFQVLGMVSCWYVK